MLWVINTHHQQLEVALIVLLESRTLPLCEAAIVGAQGPCQRVSVHSEAFERRHAVERTRQKCPTCMPVPGATLVRPMSITARSVLHGVRVAQAPAVAETTCSQVVKRLTHQALANHNSNHCTRCSGPPFLSWLPAATTMTASPDRPQTLTRPASQTLASSATGGAASSSTLSSTPRQAAGRFNHTCCAWHMSRATPM
jgi:hypothetical protein